MNISSFRCNRISFEITRTGLIIVGKPTQNTSSVIACEHNTLSRVYAYVYRKKIILRTRTYNNNYFKKLL